MSDIAPTILWLRRDLRLGDHPALTAACKSGGPVIPVFIHDDPVAGLGAAPKWRLGLGLEYFARALEGKTVLAQLSGQNGGTEVAIEFVRQGLVMKAAEDEQAGSRLDGSVYVVVLQRRQAGFEDVDRFRVRALKGKGCGFAGRRDEARW